MKKIISVVLMMCILVVTSGNVFAGSNHFLREKKKRNEATADYYFKNRIITPEILRGIEQKYGRGFKKASWIAGPAGLIKFKGWNDMLEARWDGTIYLNDHYMENWR